MSNILAIEEIAQRTTAFCDIKSKSFNIYNLDFLNKISKEHIISNRLNEKWSEMYGEIIGPINNEDWSIQDIEDAFHDNKEAKNLRSSFIYYQDNVVTTNFNDISDKDIERLNTMSKSQAVIQHSILFEELLLLYFTKEQIEEANITTSFNFKEVKNIQVSAQLNGCQLNRNISI